MKLIGYVCKKEFVKHGWNFFLTVTFLNLGSCHPSAREIVDQRSGMEMLVNRSIEQDFLAIQEIAEGFSLEKVRQIPSLNLAINEAKDYIDFAESGGLWDLIRNKRQENIDLYTDQYLREYDAFMNAPVSYTGTPALIFVLLREVMPELFGDEAFTHTVGLRKNDQKNLLPLGMVFTQGSRNGKILDSSWSTHVTLSCAACHTQWNVKSVAGGGLKNPQKDDRLGNLIIGAPSRIFDINALRKLYVKAVQSPKYRYSEFEKVLKNTDLSILFGKSYEASARKDAALFLSQGGQIGEKLLEEFKSQILKKARDVQRTLGAFSYHGDMQLLESAPGKVEAFGLATLALLPPKALENAENLKALADQYLPKNPSIADMMSVWQQNSRKLSQWDGSLKVKLLRNLGAELGVAGDPLAVNLINAQLTTDFLSELPAPPYPFRIDMKKAARGKKLFFEVCGSCHLEERFVPLDQIGTEPGRATGLTRAARSLLIDGLRAACGGADPKICGASDDDVLTNRQDQPGYQALPLAGLWARAPFLHHGTVPTVKHLLIPESRPKIFTLGQDSYDEENLGFSWNGEINKQKVIDTGINGFGSQGHSDPNRFFGGRSWKEDPGALRELLEYLKTL